MSKEEILQEVWKDVFVGDSAVFWHVAQVRRALGDDAKEPRYIQAISKKGYRLEAPVEYVAAAEPVASPSVLEERAGADDSSATRPTGRWNASKAARASAALLALAGLAFALLLVRSNRHSADTGAGPRRVAILFWRISPATRRPIGWGRR